MKNKNLKPSTLTKMAVLGLSVEDLSKLTGLSKKDVSYGIIATHTIYAITINAIMDEILEVAIQRKIKFLNT